MNYFLSLALMLYSVTAMATKEIGNGGDVVVCFKTSEIAKKASGALDKISNIYILTPDMTRNITSVELLDLFEVSKDYLHNFGEMENEDIVENVLLRLRSISLLGYDLDNFRNSAFPFSLANMTSGGVTEIDDSNHSVITSNNCLVMQLAIQKKIGNDYTQVIVNSDLYSRLPENHKAALYIHEMLYAYKRMWDEAADSNTSRELLRIIFSKRFFEKYTVDEFFNRTKSLDYLKRPQHLDRNNNNVVFMDELTDIKELKLGEGSCINYKTLIKNYYRDESFLTCTGELTFNISTSPSDEKLLASIKIPSESVSFVSSSEVQFKNNTIISILGVSFILSKNDGASTNSTYDILVKDYGRNFYTINLNQSLGIKFYENPQILFPNVTLMTETTKRVRFLDTRFDRIEVINELDDKIVMSMKTGLPISYDLHERRKLDLPSFSGCGGISIKLYGNDDFNYVNVLFHENGVVKQCTLFEDMMINEKPYKKNSMLYFDKTGAIID